MEAEPENTPSPPSSPDAEKPAGDVDVAPLNLAGLDLTDEEVQSKMSPSDAALLSLLGMC